VAVPDATPASRPANLRRLFDDLLSFHGGQHWWPGESRFEIAVGAILVQRTSWANAGAAIAALRSAGLLDRHSLSRVSPSVVEMHIRPAGFYRQKAKTALRFAEWLDHVGGFSALADLSAGEVRVGLLSLRGIGPETADCILLYALERPTFVVDAYARRILERVGVCPDAGRQSYEALQTWVEQHLPADTPLYNEYHALLVAHGQSLCRPRPDCGACPLARGCAYACGG